MFCMLDNMILYPRPFNQLFLLFCISSHPLTVEKSLKNNCGVHNSEWTFLPSLSPFGSKMKLPTCTGCLLPIESDQAIHKCLFSSKGFTLHSKPFTPCKVRYHSKCIKVGHPFATRHFGKGTKGLQYPPCATSLPFICELCTTRTQLGRELDALSPEDILLLKLERMRMIDVAHAWAPTTLQNACRSLRRTNNFFSSHNIPSLHQQLHLLARL